METLNLIPANIPGYYALPTSGAFDPILVTLWALVGAGVAAAVVVAVLVYRDSVRAVRGRVARAAAASLPVAPSMPWNGAGYSGIVLETRSQSLAAERAWAAGL